MSSSLWTLLNRGCSINVGSTLGQRLALFWGRYLARRNANVSIPRSCSISPEARIHPRRGRILMGETCSVSCGAIIQGSVCLGDRCSVQSFAVIIGEDPTGEEPGVIIGSGVRIAPMVTIISGNHVFSDPDRWICDQGIESKTVRIEDDVWIAAGARIMAGATIGTGSVVAAGAVVTKDIPPFSIAAGVPARVIKSRRPGVET